MKIKVKNMKIDTSSLVRVEWRKYYPKLIIHEKFESKIKWTLRIITFIGIGLCFFSMTWWISLIVTIGLLGIEQFFERALFEYTTMIVQPFPDFKVDYAQWKTNGFMIPKEKNEAERPYVGPAYMDKEYAQNFFDYIKSWNNGESIDNENNVVLSFIMESDDTYTTYLYANPSRKWLNPQFDIVKSESKLEKYGKKQQRFVMQMFYWHNLPYKQGYLIDQFLKFQTNKEPFFLTPFVLDENYSLKECIFNSSILKFEYKLKHRNELTKNEPEYVMKSK